MLEYQNFKANFVGGCSKPRKPISENEKVKTSHDNTNYMRYLSGFYNAEPYSRPYMLRKSFRARVQGIYPISAPYNRSLFP